MRTLATLSCVAVLGLLSWNCVADEVELKDKVELKDVVQVVVGVETAAAAEGADSSESSEPCEGAECEDGVCEDKPCDEGACEEGAEVAAAATGEEQADSEEAVAHATHKQTKVISVNGGDLTRSQLKSFCLDKGGTVLAACTAEGGEVRRFSATGDYLDTWSLPIQPEAINVGEDGHVYIAGEGKLVKMTADGEMELEVDSPHADASDEKRAKVRESVIAQFEQSIKRYKQMSDRYTKRYETLKEAVATLAQNGIALTSEQRQQVDQSKQMADQWTQILKQMGAADGSDTLSEEEIEKRVESSLRSSMAVASISESGGNVFIATREATGYGFCVWKLNGEMTEGEVIVNGLRGCCGQMDVQCCEEGVYVAENSRKRVYHVSLDGDEIGEWGHSAREGLEGFGSCCNPMNVAFGPGKSVYTAESGTGRIKRYTPEGKLIELVGKVDIVPGCKKVSIAVGPSGDKVYMLDITRHHIVLMERLAPGEESSYTETRTAMAKPRAAATVASGRAIAVQIDGSGVAVAAGKSEAKTKASTSLNVAILKAILGARTAKAEATEEAASDNP